MSSPIPSLMHYKHNKEKKTTEQVKNTDSDLHMFIATMCEKCIELDCKGAFDPSSRDKCGLYDTWLKLSPTERSKKFLASVADTTMFIEELTK